ncbi:hypothetical protein [Polynucleobacter asymbioticus]|jgi:hypothetical protein|uniref:Uncharacterized protein n=1 Tax=Polynucleobacter asymbioticus TaxID=576611 RepID=A0AAC9NHV1_9BURK|nr:hypothetical protein [Polynucleobacter asymbioticus]APB99029.1 hypothetical protein A4F89_06655 [Polynucleobacter asymbioticus]APC01331.1 hypothetical protein AOC25_06755 [Polynucleobacter asymbioticus]
MARIQPVISHTNRDTCISVSWYNLAFHIGTCTVTGGNLLTFTGTHGFVSADIGQVAYFTPTGGTTGLYTIATVPSGSSLTAIPMGFTATNVGSVACSVGDIGGTYSQGDAALDRTLQVHGTFGASGSISMFGSNDAANWYVSSDNTGALLNVTSIKVRNVFDGPLYYAPIVTAGDATTNLNSIMVFRIQLPRPAL